MCLPAFSAAANMRVCIGCTGRCLTSPRRSERRCFGLNAQERRCQRYVQLRPVMAAICRGFAAFCASAAEPRASPEGSGIERSGAATAPPWRFGHGSFCTSTCICSVPRCAVRMAVGSRSLSRPCRALSALCWTLYCRTILGGYGFVFVIWALCV